MQQSRLALDDNEGGWPDICILISLMPRYYHALLVEQTKKYEYRRGVFIHEPVTAFVYATLSKNPEDTAFPKGEIGGVVKLNTPILGLEEVIRINETESTGSREVMLDWLKGFSTASAHPIEKVYRFEKPISLSEMRDVFPHFQPPQRYVILNRNKPLLDFLKARSGTFL